MKMSARCDLPDDCPQLLESRLRSMKWSGFKTHANPQPDQMASRKILGRETSSPKEAMEQLLPDNLALKKAMLDSRLWLQPSVVTDTDQWALVPTHHVKQGDIVLSITGVWVNATMKKGTPFPEGSGIFVQFERSGQVNLSVCLGLKHGRDLCLHLHTPKNKEELGNKQVLWLRPEWVFSTASNPCMLLRAETDMAPFSGELAVLLDNHDDLCGRGGVDSDVGLQKMFFGIFCCEDRMEVVCRLPGFVVVK